MSASRMLLEARGKPRCFRGPAGQVHVNMLCSEVAREERTHASTAFPPGERIVRAPFVVSLFAKAVLVGEGGLATIGAGKHVNLVLPQALTARQGLFCRILERKQAHKILLEMLYIESSGLCNLDA
jgi:hypothetical protein